MSWVDVLPFNREEVARLITFKERVRAYSLAWSMNEADPTTAIDPARLAARLTFARFLVVTGVLSEWKECRHVVS